MLDVLTYFAKFCKITSRTGATTFPFFIFPIYVFFRADPTCNNGAGHADEEGCPSPAAFINGHPKATALVRQMKGKTETHKACGLTGHISKWPCLGACCLATAYIHPLWFLFSFLSFLPFFFFFAKRRLEWSWLQNMHTCLDASCVVLGLFCPSSQFFVPLSPFYFTLQWTFLHHKGSDAKWHMVINTRGYWCKTFMHWHCCLGGKQRWKNSGSKCHFRVETTGATFRNILNLKQLQPFTAGAFDVIPLYSFIFIWFIAVPCVTVISFPVSAFQQIHVSARFIYPSATVLLFSWFVLQTVLAARSRGEKSQENRATESGTASRGVDYVKTRGQNSSGATIVYWL